MLLENATVYLKRNKIFLSVKLVLSNCTVLFLTVMVSLSVQVKDPVGLPPCGHKKGFHPKDCLR